MREWTRKDEENWNAGGRRQNKTAERWEEKSEKQRRCEKIEFRMKYSEEEMKRKEKANESVVLVYHSSANKDRTNEKAEKKVNRGEDTGEGWKK